MSSSCEEEQLSVSRSETKIEKKKKDKRKQEVDIDRNILHSCISVIVYKNEEELCKERKHHNDG